MMRKTIVILTGLMTSGLFLMPDYANSWLVPDTGQTRCYDTDGNILEPCPQEGDTFYGQDANYTINTMSYTKLGLGGVELPDTATYAEGWIMTKDNVTGLIWEVKQNKNYISDYSNPHDADNTYSWYDSNSETNGGISGTPGEGTDIEDFINDINNENFGGYSDWRMPSREELRSIYNYGAPLNETPININYFPNTRTSMYLSSNTCADNPADAWGISFKQGYASWTDKSYKYFVRAIRNGND